MLWVPCPRDEGVGKHLSSSIMGCLFGQGQESADFLPDSELPMRQVRRLVGEKELCRVYPAWLHSHRPKKGHAVGLAW